MQDKITILYHVLIKVADKVYWHIDCPYRNVRVKKLKDYAVLWPYPVLLSLIPWLIY